MIRLLRDCFDKKGNRYKAISFSGGRYQCQSYATGKCVYFDVSEIFSSPPKKASEKIKFTEIIKKAQEPVKEEPVQDVVTPPASDVLEPVYEEPVYDYGISENEKVIISKDNVKETAEDFYADF